MRRTILAATFAVAILVTGGAPVVALTDEDVTRSIERAREWLVNQNQGGVWPQETPDYMGGRSCMALYALATVGENPSRPQMAAAITAAIARQCDKTYVRSLRAMALAVIHNKLAADSRAQVRASLAADVKWLIDAQGSHGGWTYTSLFGRDGRFDFSNTQMAILALWQASLAGIEVPTQVWERTRKLYYTLQHPDGSWNYGDPLHPQDGANSPGYGSMTAAGLASIYIIADMLDLASGCPCQGGKSGGERGDLNRRVDAALTWLSREYTVDHNPQKPREDYLYYWLYSAERVGVAAGYKYFGKHDWYKEGATYLVQQQGADGSWHGNVVETCFATLFLFKGRAPILYEKLEIPGCEWNNHRRDVANLTAYIEKIKEQPIQWQIVGLVGSVEELHEAPVLYITPETVPQFTAEEKKKLRAFTDTGGTIMVEPSCGAAAVKEWFTAFAKEVWPEWPLRVLGPDHGSFLDPNPLKQRPEVLGIDDGMRTCVFYAIDDISCPWQTKAMASREFMFQWGINLFTYATDKSPLRAKLSSATADKERYASAIRGGVRRVVKIARLKTEPAAAPATSAAAAKPPPTVAAAVAAAAKPAPAEATGDWTTNRNYLGFERIVEAAKKADITLTVDEAGVQAAGLGDRDAAYLTGSAGFTLPASQQAALKAYLAKGGFLWAEAAGGSAAFDDSFRRLAADLGWQVKIIEKREPVMTGQFKTALGYDLTDGVRFRRVLKMRREGQPFAQLEGIYSDGKLVGLYSPFDVVFSTTPYEAYGCKGYLPADAMAVAINILACITER